MTELYHQTATELAKRIRDKEVGCLELLEIFLERTAKHNPALNAIIVLEADKAGERAREADAALARGENWGPLHGVPMTIKESFDVTGTPTTWGVVEHKDNIASADALAVSRMKSIGVTLFGKTNVPYMLGDWQSFNDIYGTCNNPWDLTRTPGGSSGGSAAALAAGMTGIEAGSDIGASVRNPAHYCGVFGHKPTMGILPPTGQALPGNNVPPDINVIGPLARGADDLEVATLAMSGAGGRDAAGWKLDLPRPAKKDLKDYKVAVVLEDENCVVDGEYGDQLQATIEQLAALGVTVDDKARPVADSKRAHLVFLMLLRAATGCRLPDDVIAQHRARAEAADPDDFSYKTIVDRAFTMSHKEWLAWDEERELLCREWAGFFDDYDLVLTPMASSAAFPHDQVGDRADRMIPVNNTRQSTLDQLFWAGYPGLVFLPGTCAPAGLTRSGLPCGLQIIGPHLSDLTTIHFARLMEQNICGFAAPPNFS
ncbi:MAG: amidase [Alphaproteobacteria bacterium]|nr:amidase [Alphaproteobacteria bacterium]